jgi:hypothetical protein
MVGPRIHEGLGEPNPDVRLTVTGPQNSCSPVDFGCRNQRRYVEAELISRQTISTPWGLCASCINAESERSSVAVAAAYIRYFEKDARSPNNTHDYPAIEVMGAQVQPLY